MSDSSTSVSSRTGLPESTSPSLLRPGDTTSGLDCDQRSQFCLDVLTGLQGYPKRIDSKYLYDKNGSALFECICKLDEYYLTRSELCIMRSRGDEIGALLGRDIVLAELGSGSSLKTRLLLDCLYDPAGYLPIDISEEHLLESVAQLRAEYPTIPIEPVIGDFTQPLEIPKHLSEHPICVYFPGSTIGNYQREEAANLLTNVRRLCAGGGLLIGVDLQKPTQILERAYNDREGVTAKFSLNLLVRLNRELDANFELGSFQHVAIYNAIEGRIEIYLESLDDQQVSICGERIDFCRGERILTEYSYKYTVSGFQRLAKFTGFELQRVWMDSKKYFAVMYFTAGMMEQA
jgi:dimethylhistidine N-methyltransferase